MILFNKYLRKLRALDIQNPNLWEFYFTDNQDIQFNVVSMSLPFKSLELEKHNSGLQYYRSCSLEDSFSITFNETTDFAVLSYLKRWFNEIYDEENRVFKSGDHNKIGIMNFSKHVFFDIFSILGLPVTLKELEKNTLSVTFYNMLLASIDAIDLSYDNTSGGFTVSAEFSSSEIQFDFSNIKQPLSAAIESRISSGLSSMRLE